MLDGGQEHIAALRAGRGFGLEQPLRAREPAAGTAAVAAKEQAQAEPEGATHPMQRPAVEQMRVVRALEHREVFVVGADEIRGRGIALEVVGPKLGGTVRGAKGVERQRPGAPVIELTRAADRGSVGTLQRRFLVGHRREGTASARPAQAPCCQHAARRRRSETATHK